MRKFSSVIVLLYTIVVIVIVVFAGNAVMVLALGSPSSPPTGSASSPTGTIQIPNPLCGGGQSCTIADIIDNIVDFLLAVAGPLAVLVVLYAGFLFMTAGGSEEKLKLAKKALLSAVIGIGILLLSKGVVNVIQSILTP